MFIFDFAFHCAKVIVLVSILCNIADFNNTFLFFCPAIHPKMLNLNADSSVLYFSNWDFPVGRGGVCREPLYDLHSGGRSDVNESYIV